VLCFYWILDMQVYKESISSTLYARIFRTKFWCQKLQSYLLGLKLGRQKFCTKNVLVKRWWNWHQKWYTKRHRKDSLGRPIFQKNGLPPLSYMRQHKSSFGWIWGVYILDKLLIYLHLFLTHKFILKGHWIGVFSN